MSIKPLSPTINWLSKCGLGIQNLKPYEPGRSGRFFENDRMVKLSSNENALGCSPLVQKALKNIQGVEFYPDSTQELTEKLALYKRVNPEQITLGNGSNDVLDLIARCFVAEAKDEIIASQYGFIVYKLLVKSTNAVFIEVPAKPHYNANLNGILAAITENTKLIFLANPNNPTGTWHTPNDLLNFLEKVPKNVLVVVDQAYQEYANFFPTHFKDATPWLQRFENLIVTGSFSKAFGLAGLRMGYALSNPQIANLLNRIRQPFNVNNIALLCANTALDDLAFIKNTQTHNAHGLIFLTTHLKQLNIEYIPSISNFITIQDPRAALWYEALLQNGLIVRPLDSYGMTNCLRVTIGLEAHQKQFIDTLEKHV